MNHEIKKLHDSRLKRVTDAISLKKPDRVPVIIQPEAFPVLNSGDTTMQEAMEDWTRVGPCLDKFYLEFQPDLGWGPGLIFPAKPMNACGLKYMRWPGNGIEEKNEMYQFIEGEFMKEDEYLEFAHDPTHFIQSKWIPRAFSRLKGLEHLNLRNSIWMGWMGSFSAFANPGLLDALDALKKTAEELIGWFTYTNEYETKMINEMGFPPAWGSNAFAPFDLVGDTMRGTINIMMDMIYRPDEVLAAVDAMMPMALDAPINLCRATGRKFVWIWLHKGVDDFMSEEQFLKFYWPTLQKLICGLVDEGLTPIVYCEGKYNSRLEIIRDVPKGKVVYDFEEVDMIRAKEVLGDTACIAGNVPNAMLAFGTPQEVDDYCRELIRNVGQDGGFMLDAQGLIDNAKPECLRAMFDSVKKYS